MAGVAGKLGSIFAWNRRNKSGNGEVVRMEDGRDTEAAKQVTLSELRRGYGEVVETVKAVRQHLEEQSQRGAQMLEVMQALPELLRSTSDSNRQQSKVLEALQESVARQARSSSDLSGALASLASATGKHEHVLQAVGRQIEAADATRAAVGDRLAALDATMRQVDEGARASSTTLKSLADEAKANDSAIRELVKRNTRQVALFSAVSWVLAIVALAVAAYMAVLVARMTPAPEGKPPASSTPPPATAPTQ